MIKILRISAVIALFTLLWFALPVLAHKQGVWDFSGFWGAAKLFMQGKNPYDLEAKIQFLSSQGVLATNLRPLNPPPFVFLFIPFSYVDFDTAKNLWILLSLVTYLLAVGITLKQITSCDGTSSKRNIRVEELGLVLLLLPLPILYHLSVGQVTVFCCLCSVLSISEKSSGESSFNLFLRGVALSFTCIKPHLFIPLYIFFTLSWCHAKNLWPLIGLLTGIAIVILCSYFPHDGAMWKHYFSSLGESPLYTGTPSLGAVL